jgi:hypothetical protein
MPVPSITWAGIVRELAAWMTVAWASLALAGERQQVTGFFADLNDSTALSRGRDPEAAQQLLDPALHRMMDAVHRIEGPVNQVLRRHRGQRPISGAFSHALRQNRSLTSVKSRAPRR